MRSSGRRLLMVSTVLSTLRVFLMPFAERLRLHGWAVDAAVDTSPGSEAIVDAFDKIWQLPWTREVMSPGNARAVREMRFILESGGYDIVHVHTPIAAMATRLAAASLGRNRPKIVYTAHGFHFHDHGSRVSNELFALGERLGGRWTDSLIVINEQDYRAALRRRLVPRDRLTYIPGIGIDLGRFAPTAELRAQADALRRQIRVPATVPLFTMVAEFQPRKNHLTAIRALDQSQPPTAHLALAGEGPTESAVRDEVARLGLGDRVHFMGYMEDVRALVLASEATLLPSWREGLSRAVLESLALGVPVVGGDSRGIRDLLDDDLGMLVDPDDVQGLARALEAILTYPNRGALRARAEERLQRYSFDSIAAQQDAVYARVLGEAPNPNPNP